MEEIRQCPLCEGFRMKDNACNYVTCGNNYENNEIKCIKPWCWLCLKPKYELYNGKEHLGFCNDKTHNSH